MRATVFTTTVWYHPATNRGRRWWVREGCQNVILNVDRSTPEHAVHSTDWVRGGWGPARDRPRRAKRAIPDASQILVPLYGTRVGKGLKGTHLTGGSPFRFPSRFPRSLCYLHVRASCSITFQPDTTPPSILVLCSCRIYNLSERHYTPDTAVYFALAVYLYESELTDEAHPDPTRLRRPRHPSARHAPRLPPSPAPPPL